jgi:O-antigen/teichoic acid export membrane protein
MVVATFVAALGALAFQLLGRVLGATDFAPVTALWTIQFLVFTIVLLPIEQYVVRLRSLDSEPDRSVVAGLIAAVAVTATAIAWLGRDTFFDGSAIYALMTALLVVGYGGYAVGRGRLAGARRFRDYGKATIAESLVRLAFGLIVLAIVTSAAGLSWSLVVAPLVIIPWWTRRARGAETRGRGDAGEFLAGFITGNAASQTILAAGPLVVPLIGGTAAAQSMIFETFLLFRAPLTLSYNLVSRVLPPFTRMAEQGERAALRRWSLLLAAGALVVGAVAAAAGAVAGPPLVSALLGDEFRPTTAIASLAAFGVVLATAALFLQQILAALAATRRLAAAWIVGLIAAAAVIVVGPADPALRTAAGFAVGEAVALVALAFAVWGLREN